jgi:hypothetical protein
MTEDDHDFYIRLNAAFRTVSRGNAEPPPTQAELNQAHATLAALVPAAAGDPGRQVALETALSQVGLIAIALGLRQPNPSRP